MALLTLQRTLDIHQGKGFVLETQDGFTVLSADKILSDKYEGTIKRKIGLSLCSGCQVGCIYCFTKKYPGFRPLTSAEIIAQAEMILQASNGNTLEVSRTKVSLKQMGDPLMNPRNTLKAIAELHITYPEFTFVVSTSGPACKPGFFSFLQKLQEKGVGIRIQFSCHTTSDVERAALSSQLLMLSFVQIAEIVRNWHGTPASLNFVLMKGFEYDVEKLARMFDPRRVFVKVNYIDKNSQTELHKLEDADDAQIFRFVEGLRRYGFNYAYRHR